MSDQCQVRRGNDFGAGNFAPGYRIKSGMMDRDRVVLRPGCCQLLSEQDPGPQGSSAHFPFKVGTLSPSSSSSRYRARGISRAPKRVR